MRTKCGVNPERVPTFSKVASQCLPSSPQPIVIVTHIFHTHK